MKSQIIFALIGCILFSLSRSSELVVINDDPNTSALSCTNTQESITQCSSASPTGHTKVCVLDSQGNGKCLWHDYGGHFHPVGSQSYRRNLNTLRELQCDLSTDCSESNVNQPYSCYFGLGTCQYCIPVDTSYSCSDFIVVEPYSYCCYVA